MAPLLAQSPRMRSRAHPPRQTFLQSSSGRSQNPAGRLRGCWRCHRRLTPCLRPSPTHASSSPPALHPQPPPLGRRGPASLTLVPRLGCLPTPPASHPLGAARRLPVRDLATQLLRRHALAQAQDLVGDQIPPSAAQGLTLAPAQALAQALVWALTPPSATRGLTPDPAQALARGLSAPSASLALAPRRWGGRGVP